MKIIFFGTSDFAVAALKAILLSKHKILGVVTAQDKKKGRGQKLGVSAVKMVAMDKTLPFYQPANLQDVGFLQILKSSRAELFVVCDFGKILTKEVLQIPKRCAINLHASLLPKYRGAAPINWAIIKGEQETGVTVFKMNEFMDQGEIILQRKAKIASSDTACGLETRLARVGACVLLEAIGLIECAKAPFVAQDDREASLAPKLKKEDGLIDWTNSALDIHNQIRGMQPWPGAFTYFQNKLFKIWESKLLGDSISKEPGKILDVDPRRGILVQTGKGNLFIVALQLEGRKKMSAAEFILGHTIETGERLG